MKYLKKELDALDATIEQNLASAKQEFDAEMREKSITVKILGTWDKNMKACLAKAAAAIAKLKTATAKAAHSQTRRNCSS